MSFKTAKFSVVQCDVWQILADDFTTKHRPPETFLRKGDLRDVLRCYQDFLLMIWPKATVEDRTRMMRWAELREVRVAAGGSGGGDEKNGRPEGRETSWLVFFFFFRVNPASLKREVSKNVLANRDLLYLRLSHSATFSELWTEVDAAVTCVVIFGSARSEEGKWQGNYEQDKLALKQKSAKTSWQAFLKHETSYILRLENVRSAIDSIYSNFIIIVIIIIINYIIIIILPRRSDQVAR